MSLGDKFKWLYSFALLVITMIWAAFCVATVVQNMNYPTAEGILGASGTGILLGALITWNAQIVTFWFRKKAPTDKEVK